MFKAHFQSKAIYSFSKHVSGISSALGTELDLRDRVVNKIPEPVEFFFLVKRKGININKQDNVRNQ